ncbi:hypothetical protein HGD80_04085 [Paulownia witches'-broom phytoplasma]|uniref:Uncharacterized protein n=1 Tax=Paulownia witches'-broom phytoplasma TaxID=39647 RepID=A0ABX8TP29_9MOLU|nr:hypothetical protein [Paulownia witches'-broom phytoplasma]QYC30915.1 hypothetical protein HGD80_04085 [Paulownia witches'-broom phytoplasma]GLH60592.1 hypothetical protein PAWBP_3300 [Paulownia witches'-broom phytoplasma]
MLNANILEIKKRLDALEIEESNQEQYSTASNDDKLHVSIDDLYEIKNGYYISFITRRPKQNRSTI